MIAGTVLRSSFGAAKYSDSNGSMFPKRQISLRMCFILLTGIAVWCGFLTALWRLRMPVNLRNVEYRHVKDFIWLRELIPEGATNITVFFTRGDSVHSRFRLPAQEFKTWIESEGLAAPDFEGTLVVSAYIVMGDDGINLPYGTLIHNAQAWDRDWNSSDWKRLVIYERDTQIVRLSTYRSYGESTIPAVELLPSALSPVPRGSTPQAEPMSGASAKHSGANATAEHMP